jgi:hypothetical protein
MLKALWQQPTDYEGRGYITLRALLDAECPSIKIVGLPGKECIVRKSKEHSAASSGYVFRSCVVHGSDLSLYCVGVH